MARLDIPQEDIQPDVVRAALAGQVERVPPSVALRLVTQLDLPSAGQQALLLDAVRDEKVEEYIRAGALRVYTLAAGESSIPELVKALDSPQERVAAAAASALGQVGTPEQLAALRRRKKGGALLDHCVLFAQVLIVHRFGLADDVALPKPALQPAPVGTGALTFKTVRPGPERRKSAIEGLRREFPSLDAAKQDVYELQCGPRLMEIAFDQTFLGAAGPGERALRPAMPAIVAYADQEHGEFHPGLLVLSRGAAKERFTLVLTRVTGEQVYVGEGAGAKSEFEFDLHAVKAPGVAAITAHVRVTARGAEISGVSERRALPGVSPAKEQG
jgi:HEAT repeats